MSKVLIGVAAVVGFLAVGILLIPTIAQGQKETESGATEVTPGVFTERQHEYSKEYKKMYAGRNSRNLSLLAIEAKQRGTPEVSGVSIGVPGIPSLANVPEESYLAFFRRLACGSDAVVIGSARKKEAQLTDDETFAYTEYEFVVSNVLKDNSTSPISGGNVIAVTRPGGLMRINGQLIKAEDRSYEPLELKKTYLLYLRYVPTAQGYVVANAKGDFAIDGNSFRPLSKRGTPSRLRDISTSDDLVSEIRNSINTGCEEPLERNQ